MGGSTNMYLHLLAIAHEAEVPLSIEHIQSIGERVPSLPIFSPMTVCHGIAACAGWRADRDERTPRHGYLHADAMTVTGKTIAENLRTTHALAELGEQDVVLPVTGPIAPPNNHISVLKGISRRKAAS